MFRMLEGEGIHEKHHRLARSGDAGSQQIVAADPGVFYAAKKRHLSLKAVHRSADGHLQRLPGRLVAERGTQYHGLVAAGQGIHQGWLAGIGVPLPRPLQIPLRRSSSSRPGSPSPSNRIRPAWMVTQSPSSVQAWVIRYWPLPLNSPSQVAKIVPSNNR